MNLTQSPPYRRAESAHKAIKSGSTGIISRFGKIFLRGGRKTNDLYNHLSKSVSKSIVSPIVSLLIHVHGAIETASNIITTSYYHHNGTNKE